MLLTPGMGDNGSPVPPMIYGLAWRLDKTFFPVKTHPRRNNESFLLPLRLVRGILQRLSGDQIGQGFGHALVLADVNGDDVEDLIVGSPFHNIPQLDRKAFDVGRVTIFYGDPETHQFRPNNLDVLTGQTMKGHFGEALASVGDINKDGIGDFVVGAPYAGAGGKGAVYLFHGSARGVVGEPAQTIEANSFGSDLAGFGFALSGGLDLDDNAYPDVSIAALYSDRVVHLWTKPVIKARSSLRVLPEIIDAERKDCTIMGEDYANGDIWHTCVHVEYCMLYSGEGVDEGLRFNVTVELDTLLPIHLRRMFALSDGGIQIQFKVEAMIRQTRNGLVIKRVIKGSQ
jgi:integrin alpha 8